VDWRSPLFLFKPHQKKKEKKTNLIKINETNNYKKKKKKTSYIMDYGLWIVHLWRYVSVVPSIPSSEKRWCEGNLPRTVEKGQRGVAASYTQ
jgi:hypothetical protein